MILLCGRVCRKLMLNNGKNIMRSTENIHVAVVGLGYVGMPLALAVAAMTVAFLSASQDIVADAYRTDVLPRAELGAELPGRRAHPSP